MKNIEVEYYDLIIINDEGVLSVIVFDKDNLKGCYINPNGWQVIDNYDVIEGIRKLKADDCDLEEYINAYKNSKLYKEIEDYVENREQDYDAEYEF